MQIEIPDELVSRATKAANWYFGKDTSENQIAEILTKFCETKEELRKEEEAELNAKIKAAKEKTAGLAKCSGCGETLIAPDDGQPRTCTRCSYEEDMRHKR